MDEKQFLCCLNDDFPQLKVSLHNLDQPSPEFVRKYYSVLVEAVTRLSARMLCSFTAEQSEFLQGPGNDPSIANHLSKLNLYKMAKFIFDRIGLPNFHYSDILFPHLSKHRSLVFMSTMYHFYASCAEFDECYEELQEENDIMGRISQLKEEQNHLQQCILEKKASKSALVEKISMIKKELLEHASKHEQAQNTLRELGNEEAEIMKKLHQLEEEEVKEQAIRNKVDGEKMHLESLIVPDEYQILDYHGKLQTKKAECTQELEILERKKRSLVTKLGQFEKVLNLQEDLASTLTKEVIIGNRPYDFRGLSEALPLLKKDCDMFSKVEAEISSKIRDLVAKTTEGKEELSRLTEEKTSMTCVWKEKFEKYRIMIESLERSLSESERRSNGSQCTVEARKHEAEKLRNQIMEKTSELEVKHASYNREALELEKLIKSELISLQAKAESYCSKSK